MFGFEGLQGQEHLPQTFHEGKWRVMSQEALLVRVLWEGRLLGKTDIMSTDS